MCRRDAFGGSWRLQGPPARPCHELLRFRYVQAGDLTRSRYGAWRVVKRGLHDTTLLSVRVSRATHSKENENFGLKSPEKMRKLASSTPRARTKIAFPIHPSSKRPKCDIKQLVSLGLGGHLTCFIGHAFIQAARPE